jgi:hypothetical protein
MPVTYPHWDSENRYIVAGKAGKETVFGQAIQHQTGYWRIRCLGGTCRCPVHNNLSGYFYTLPEAQAALVAHCTDIHYVEPA